MPCLDQRGREGKAAPPQRLPVAAETLPRDVLLERLTARQVLAHNALLMSSQQRLERLSLRLQGADPRRVLERGYAWLTDEEGHAVTRAAALAPGQALTATLADGQVPLQVRPEGG